jgi:hypothetical protein
MKIVDIFKKVLLAEDQDDVTSLIPDEVELEPGQVNRQPEKSTLVLDKTVMITDLTPPDRIQCHWETRASAYEFGIKLDTGDVHDWVLALALTTGATKIVWRVLPYNAPAGRKYAVLSLHK